MQTTHLFSRLKTLGDNDPDVRALTTLVEDVHRECTALAKTVVKDLPEYTLHDQVHMKQVIDIMGRLIPEETRNRLKPLEIAALLLSAILHDIGMAPPEAEVDCLLGISDTSEYGQGVDRYQAQRKEHPEILRQIDALRVQNRHPEADKLERRLLAHYLRITHAERSMTFVRKKYGDRFKYANYFFCEDMARVCNSHNEDPANVADMSCRRLVRGFDEYCNWRFVAVVLRLADVLDFDSKRTPRLLFRHLGVCTPESISEWQKQLSVCAVGIEPHNITVSAKCPDPYTHHEVLKHKASVQKELEACNNLILKMHHPQKQGMRGHYRLDLPSKVNDEAVEPQVDENGSPVYEYENLAFHLDNQRIMDLVMGISLYTERRLFLRELLQNPVDTCRHRAALHRANSGRGDYSPKITVRLMQADGGEIVEVEDNGMGMERDVVTKHFARVGSSYYRSREFVGHADSHQLDFRPISQFGIGVLSAFMVADRLDVETRPLGDRKSPFSLGIGGPSALFWIREGTRRGPGTSIRLPLKVPSTQFLLTEERQGKKRRQKTHIPSLVETVKRLAPHLEFPIEVDDDGKISEISGAWKFPEAHPAYSNLMERIELDLTAEAPEGLDGVACAFLLRQGLRSQLPRYERFIELDDDPEATDIFHSFYSGEINAEQPRYDLDGCEVDSYYHETVSCEGTWTQQGFHVPYPLLTEHSNWDWRHLPEGPWAYFPFPLHYDLDLHSSFALPLTADRKSVLPTDEAYAICETIAKILGELLLKRIGRDAILPNKDFFAGMLDWNSSARQLWLPILAQYFDVEAELERLQAD